ncbi:flagellin [Sinanaerobacter chloroacetimidivorans]|uniref:Flagellin n=1 Tax=Sinanaerobacter chloroacetimidivorans TaxID=2818044 RepID=A0A8J8B199_9FIRM|nr:flagellin [Sinanaerobacter chloroacetimidivorans]MBR0597517.1 flagellin [Sinanaerobacter chloroacetimidivorans]
MRINHNIAALNTYRQLSGNTGATAKSLEKLSSGLRINRAGDDAAGLAISEKMRGQIRGLDQASRNASDGISLIQTAEGALNETHSILQRMRELANQAANGTNTTEDRGAIQQELTELTTEIDRIASTTEFNTKKLLDGSFADSFQIGSNSGQDMKVAIGAMTSNALGLNGGVELNKVTDADAAKLSPGTYTVESDGTNDLLKSAAGDTVGTIDLTTGIITLADTTSEIDLGHAVTLGSSVKIDETGATLTLAKGTGADVGKLAAGNYKISGTNLVNGDKLVGTITVATGSLQLADGSGTVDLTQYGLTAGAGEDLDDGDTFTIKGVDVSSAANASGSLDTLDAAIKTVSDQRSKLGAYQNRLEHTINNLGTSSENLSAAESRIRDVDMAKEMMEFTKNNILSQAAQAMLAQANQQPQGVLQLLQ